VAQSAVSKGEAKKRATPFFERLWEQVETFGPRPSRRPAFALTGYGAAPQDEDLMVVRNADALTVRLFRTRLRQIQLTVHALVVNLCIE